ncbi:hypothetical protein BD626DRAFT_505877 [Schizophyllum amplum]|uniref:Uncharacterized protein n=1 Tax=Schizophyllum amplum TaxID=97359 RepID=A0A550C696_9AGAR|nr:hypothetical protein BD626DRAFT_505877 [Auriculariopsis ampla]
MNVMLTCSSRLLSICLCLPRLVLLLCLLSNLGDNLKLALLHLRNFLSPSLHHLSVGLCPSFDMIICTVATYSYDDTLSQIQCLQPNDLPFRLVLASYSPLTIPKVPVAVYICSKR